MKKRKVFVSINIDNSTKKYIFDKTAFLRDNLDANWTASEKLHVTVLYLGYVADEDIWGVCEGLKRELKELHPFEMNFESLETKGQASRPKMLWLSGSPSEDFLRAKRSISRAVNKTELKKDSGNEPHITLARFKSKQAAAPAEISQLIKRAAIKALVPVSNIDIMESVNEKGVWKHYLLEQFEL